MELERMRRILAEGLGWMAVPEEGECDAWIDATRTLKYWSFEWHPDTDWAQAGKVFEMMCDLGWTFEIDSSAGGQFITVYRNLEDGEIAIADADTFPEAVSVATARALESEANDEG